MPGGSLADHLVHAYYKGRRLKQWKYAAITLVAISGSGAVAYSFVASLQNPIDGVILPDAFALLALSAGLSRKTWFLIPFWVAAGILVGSVVRVVGL